MKCRNCGYEYEEGIYCPECGTKYNVDEAKISVNNEVNRKDKKVPWFLSIPFIIIVYLISLCFMLGIPGIVLAIVRLILCKNKRLSSSIMLGSMIAIVLGIFVMAFFIVQHEDKIQSEAMTLIEERRYEDARILLDEEYVDSTTYTYAKLYYECYVGEGNYEEAAKALIEYCESVSSPTYINEDALSLLEECKSNVSEETYNKIVEIQERVRVEENGENIAEDDIIVAENMSENNIEANSVPIEDENNGTDGSEIDDKEQYSDMYSRVEQYLNIYETNIIISDVEPTGNGNFVDIDTIVYIDDVQAGAGDITNSIYVESILEEGMHELYVTKIYNDKEYESNIISFEVSSKYDNYIYIDLTRENKKEYFIELNTDSSYTLFVETGAPEAYEEYYDPEYGYIQLERTEEGKTVLCTVEFYVECVEYNGIIYGSSFFETITVKYGEAVNAPVAPEIPYHTFVGWSEDLTEITSNIKVYAQYERNAENDILPEYLGEYQYVAPDGFICNLSITRITDQHVYYSINFWDKRIEDEVVFENAQAIMSDGQAVCEYDVDGDGVLDYSFKFHFFEYEENEYAILFVDPYKVTNCDNRFDKI